MMETRKDLFVRKTSLNDFVTEKFYYYAKRFVHKNVRTDFILYKANIFPSEADNFHSTGICALQAQIRFYA